MFRNDGPNLGKLVGGQYAQHRDGQRFGLFALFGR